MHPDNCHPVVMVPEDARRTGVPPGWQFHPRLCTLGALPTVLRLGPYRFFAYSADRDEPPHVHVEREGSGGKFWLEPVRLESSRGFGRVELRGGMV